MLRTGSPSQLGVSGGEGTEHRDLPAAHINYLECAHEGVLLGPIHSGSPSIETEIVPSFVGTEIVPCFCNRAIPGRKKRSRR